VDQEEEHQPIVRSEPLGAHANQSFCALHRLRESIGQFDFAVFLMSVAELKSAEPPVVMSDGTRVVGREGLTSLLRQLFPAGPARDAVFPLDDEDLALALRRFDHSLMERGYSAFGWYGETEDFINRHSQPQTT
jgi:hypothetical protein